MTLAEAGEVFAYWEQNPPAHLMLQMIARMLGWTPVPAVSTTNEEITASPPPGLAVARGGSLGMPAPLDLAALRDRNRTRAVEIARRNRRPAPSFIAR
ncbi:MAG TPA: hypothetical protein VND87_03030 [Stellaceae bacterium]|nr:hypothetical protein [Stellaceae bacterium]